MATVFYLIRHGQSLSNIDGTFTGQQEFPLSELGKKQAEKLKDYFENIKLDAIFSSDLSRAYDTALPIARSKNLEIIRSRSFREIYAGEWEGEKYGSIKQNYEKDYNVWKNDTGNSRPSGGESFKELGERVFSKLSEIASEYDGKTVAVATHATPIRALQTLAEYSDVSSAAKIGWVFNASVSKYIYDNGKLILEYASDISHLGDMTSTLPKSI